MLGLNRLSASRRNGLLMMIQSVQKKQALEVSTESERSMSTAETNTTSRSRQQTIRNKLAALDPVVLEVVDVSHQHAGHAGVQRGATETHFNLKIVSPKFDGRTLVKRHRLVYDLLQEELQNGLHALSIVAKTPAEAERV